MNTLQILATLFSLVYILLAAKNKAICFVFGAVASTIWAFEDFTNLNLKFDGVLQIFYVAMAFYGFYNWNKSTEKQMNQPIRRLGFYSHIIVITSGLIVSILLAFLASNLFETALPYLDAITTGFSIVATYLLTKRYIDNWFYWIVVNPIYMYIYYRSGAYLFVGVMFLYTIMSFVGYLDWKKEMKLESIQ